MGIRWIARGISAHPPRKLDDRPARPSGSACAPCSMASADPAIFAAAPPDFADDESAGSGLGFNRKPNTLDPIP